VQVDQIGDGNLYLQKTRDLRPVIVLGEVLWDLFDHSRCLGGAPLNFGVHARRLGHPVTLISAVGTDELGAQATERIQALGLDTSLIQTDSRYATGTAKVQLSNGGGAHFTIQRPAAYDAVEISEAVVQRLQQMEPGWFYYGTLFASRNQSKKVLDRLLSALGQAINFYDLNLRPGFDSPDLVRELLAQADVVKLNEDELHEVHELTGLPASVEDFCRAGADRYGWQAVGVTLGDRGCAISTGGQYAAAAGHPVNVVDTVGAGAAFAAAFLHGLSKQYTAAEIASFANRVGALVASRQGATPDWTMEEAVSL